MLKVYNLTKGYGADIILNKVSFVIGRGKRVGLVGQNGIGKSTLLKIIAGIEKPDGGMVELQKGATLAYMPQSGVVAPHADVFKGAGKMFANLHLSRLNFDSGACTLSGGERSKVNLAHALSARADYYLLDEPTNNLDFPALRFLERAILEDADASFLIVSHDREFLDKVVDTIFEIDEFSRSLKEYVGNYSQYEEEKRRERERDFKKWEGQQKQRMRLEKSLEEKKMWVGKADKGPKKKDNNKIGRGFAKDRSKVLGNATRNIETRLQNIESVEKPRDHWDLHFTIPAERSGDIVFRAKGIETQRGEFHLGPLSFELQHGERAALLGLNGAGKTTLLNILAGKNEPEKGVVVRGSNTNIGFLEQILANDNEIILNKIIRVTGLPETDARKLLHKFGLGKDDVAKQFGMLSPGERMRLELAGFVARRVNVLILDEPTNNLDLEAIAELERVIREFTGTLLVVTHDRRFLTNVGIDTFYALERGVLRKINSLESYEKTAE